MICFMDMTKAESDRQYYLKNKDKVRKTNELWKERNKERLLQVQKNYYYRNRDKILAKQRTIARKLYSKNKELYSERNRARWVRYKNEMYEKLGGKKCVVCGFSDERALAIDHINNDGYKDRKLSKSISQIRRRVLDNLERYQILCFNCNQIKRIEHEKENRLKKESMAII